MEKYLQELLQAKNIALFTHTRPDPDAVGSTLAMRQILQSLNKNVDIFCGGEVEESYNLLEDIVFFNKKSCKSYDLFVSLDMATPNMLGEHKDWFLSQTNTMKLDHHIAGSDFAKVNVSKNYSAMAIFVYQIATRLKVKVNKSVASRLFFGIAGDTGNFRYSNADALTFKVASKLIECGADNLFLQKQFFDKTTLAHIALSSLALLSAELDKGKNYAILTASKQDFELSHASEMESISNLPNYYLNAGVKVAVILKELSDGVHCSFRSNEGFDCSAVASKYGGGGHKCAAGCTASGDVEQIKAELIKIFDEYFKNKQ